MATKKTKPSAPLSPELASLPDRLKAARKTRDIDSTKLDELAGVSQGRTSRAEGGKRLERITADAAVKLSKALGVHVEWLLVGRGEMWDSQAGNPEPARSTVRPTSSRKG